MEFQLMRSWRSIGFQIPVFKLDRSSNFLKKKATLPVKEKSKGGKYYIVQTGDNPWTIAHANGMQVEELLRLNGIDEKKAKKLRPGDRLKIKWKKVHFHKNQKKSQNSQHDKDNLVSVFNSAKIIFFH